jgi:hypothetical protein
MLHKMTEEKVEAAKAEVQRLLDVSFIREVTYTEWVANIVMVKKKNGKWRMCIDFTDLNKCGLKDDFPLAKIDQIIDSAVASERMALLDCFSRYHQIWLLTEDEEKTSFITLFRTSCYLNMPWGGALERRSNILQNDEGSVKGPSRQKCALVHR